MNAGLYDYWLVFVTGLLSAPHCIGMCGGIMSTMTL
ncbi:sulfite exporter TauE/SafE family protein, partial [Mesorhizobium sp. M00.F.Ca.ET.186.01.1.1]